MSGVVMYHKHSIASTLALFLVGACASGTVAPPDTGTETAVPVDVGTESPCGPGSPEGCERVGNTCMSPAFPPYVPRDNTFSDEEIYYFLMSAPSCGYVGVTMCEDPSYFAFIAVSEMADIQRGMIVQEDAGVAGVDVWNVLTRERVAFGIFDGFPADGGCTRRLYGDSAMYGCLEAAYQQALLTVPTCAADVTCDFCACRVNEVTDATSPDCVQP